MLLPEFLFCGTNALRMPSEFVPNAPQHIHRKTTLSERISPTNTFRIYVSIFNVAVAQRALSPAAG